MTQQQPDDLQMTLVTSFVYRRPQEVILGVDERLRDLQQKLDRFHVSFLASRVKFCFAEFVPMNG